MEDLFDKIGKKTPYTVPENYFANMQQQLCAQASAAQPQKAQPFSVSKRMRKVFWISSMTAAAAIFLGIVVLKPWQPTDAASEYDQALAEYCDALYSNETSPDYNYGENDLFMTEDMY